MRRAGARDRSALVDRTRHGIGHEHRVDALEGDLGRLELALLLQFTLPGSPMIYYGDENGMAGSADPLNRMPMVWDPDRWNGGVRALYRRMIALRAGRVAASLRDTTGPIHTSAPVPAAG